MPAQFLEVEFPRNIAQGSKGGPGFNTTIYTAVSGREQRNVNWQDARALYDVSYGITDKADMDTVLEFFYNMRGKATGFRYFDWSDYQLTGEIIAVGDTVATVFQITKKYRAGSNIYTREIKKVIGPHAVGSILFTSQADNADTVTINDGVHTPVVFTFGNGTGGTVNKGTTAIESAQNLRTAINVLGGSVLNVEAVGNQATLTITNNNFVTGSITKVDVDNDYTVTTFAMGASGVIVAVNGVVKTEGVDYTLDYDTGIITFVSAPAAYNITVTCQFHVPVRFDVDSIEVILDAWQIESLQSIKLVELKLA